MNTKPMDLESKFISNFNSLGPFENKPHIAIAVSGGADSMALLCLSKLWSKKNNAQITAITFDHLYRDESSDEAIQVSKWLKNLDINHVVLKNSGKKPSGNIQEEARVARYQAMTKFCEDKNILHLLLGHHMNDQAETFLNRLARGSGASGLAAMAKISAYNNTQLLRPLLDFSKEDLKNYLKETGQKWMEDPSNSSIKYTRNRIRMALKEADDEDLINKRIADSAKNLAYSKQVEEEDIAKLLAQHSYHSNDNYLLLNINLLKEEFKLLPLVISRILSTISGNAKPPRQEKIRTLIKSMKAADSSAKFTLHGCIISKNGHRWKFDREEKNNNYYALENSFPPPHLDKGEIRQNTGEINIKKLPAKPLAGLPFDCYICPPNGY